MPRPRNGGRLVATAALVGLEVMNPAGWRAVAFPFALLAVLAAVPHGALDDRLYAATRGGDRRAVWAAYAASVVAVGLGWWLAPALVFAAFLVVAAHHFGEAELPRAASRTAVVSRGATYVALLVAAGARQGESLAWTGLAWPAGTESGALALAAVAGLFHFAHGRERLRFAAACTLLTVADPWVGFAGYFALWHAPDHWTETRRGLAMPLGPLLRRAAPNAILALVGVGAAWLFARQASPGGVLLAGLVVVTLPHALVFHLALRGAPARGRGAWGVWGESAT